MCIIYSMKFVLEVSGNIYTQHEELQYLEHLKFQQP